jgi:hypothetical protein
MKEDLIIALVFYTITLENSRRLFRNIKSSFKYAEPSEMFMEKLSLITA